MKHFETRFDPVVAYLLTPDEAIYDRSGHGIDLTPIGSNFLAQPSYIPGLASLYLDPNNYFRHDNPATQITGDLTLEVVCTRENAGSSTYVFAQQNGDGETSDTNVLWTGYFADNQLAMYYEAGNGTDIGPRMGANIRNIGVFCHWVITRAASGSNRTHIGYWNGYSVGQQTVGTAPSGGSNTYMTVGGTIRERIQYLAVYDKVLTPDQISYLARLRGVSR